MHEFIGHITKVLALKVIALKINHYNYLLYIIGATPIAWIPPTFCKVVHTIIRKTHTKFKTFDPQCNSIPGIR